MEKSLFYLDEKKNEIGGLFGSRMNALLHRKYAAAVDCKLIGDVELGVEIDPNNHTFSGALGLLQAGKGDVMMQSLSRHLKKDWFEHSQASSYEKLSLKLLTS